MGHLAWAGSALLTEPEEAAHKAAAAAGAEHQQLGRLGHLQQHTGGVAVLNGGIDVDVVAGNLVHRLLDDGFGPLADHRIIHGGVAAVQPGRGKDRHGICGDDVQRPAAALSLAGRPDQGALAVVRSVDAHHDSQRERRNCRRRPVPGPDASHVRPLGRLLAILPDVAAILPEAGRSPCTRRTGHAPDQESPLPLLTILGPQALSKHAQGRNREVIHSPLRCRTESASIAGKNVCGLGYPWTFLFCSLRGTAGPPMLCVRTSRASYCGRTLGVTEREHGEDACVCPHLRRRKL